MSIGKQLITMLGIAIFGIIAVFSIGMTKMEQVYEKTNTCNVILTERFINGRYVAGF